MPDIVLFGVGSPLTVDAEETCGRLGLNRLAGIRNREGEVFLLKRDAGSVLLPISIRRFRARLVSVPYSIPSSARFPDDMAPRIKV